MNEGVGNEKMDVSGNINRCGFMDCGTYHFFTYFSIITIIQDGWSA